MRLKTLGTLLGALFASGVAFSSASAPAAEFTAAQKAEFGGVIREYLIAHPEVIKDAIEELDKREKAAEASAREKVMTKESERLFKSANQAVVGNPDGDVTLVEFFDYNCGYCKRSLETVAKLIESDPKLRVVLKDFAILGPDSVEVAQVATAARRQLHGPKFWEFHRKLLSVKGHAGKAQAMAAAKELGCDMDQLERDLKGPEVKATLEEVQDLAMQLHFEGTPAWVAGNEAFVGGLSYDAMKSKIDSIRKCGKSIC